jgi:hypothetical protein
MNGLLNAAPRVIKDKTIAASEVDINKRRLWLNDIFFFI